MIPHLKARIQRILSNIRKKSSLGLPYILTVTGLVERPIQVLQRLLMASVEDGLNLEEMFNCRLRDMRFNAYTSRILTPLEMHYGKKNRPQWSERGLTQLRYYYWIKKYLKFGEFNEKARGIFNWKEQISRLLTTCQFSGQMPRFWIWNFYHLFKGILPQNATRIVSIWKYVRKLGPKKYICLIKNTICFSKSATMASLRWNAYQMIIFVENDSELNRYFGCKKSKEFQFWESF